MFTPASRAQAARLTASGCPSARTGVSPPRVRAVRSAPTGRWRAGCARSAPGSGWTAGGAAFGTSGVQPNALIRGRRDFAAARRLTGSDCVQGRTPGPDGPGVPVGPADQTDPGRVLPTTSPRTWQRHRQNPRSGRRQSPRPPNHRSGHSGPNRCPHRSHGRLSGNAPSRRRRPTSR